MKWVSVKLHRELFIFTPLAIKDFDRRRRGCSDSVIMDGLLSSFDREAEKEINPLHVTWHEFRRERERKR